MKADEGTPVICLIVELIYVYRKFESVREIVTEGNPGHLSARSKSSNRTACPVVFCGTLVLAGVLTNSCYSPRQETRLHCGSTPGKTCAFLQRKIRLTSTVALQAHSALEMSLNR